MMPLALPLLYSALARLTNFTSPLLTLLRNNWQPREPWGAPCATRKFGKHLLFGADDGNKHICEPNITLRSSSPCTIVSVGSNGDATFETSMREFSPWCQTDTWDGTLTGHRAGLKKRLPAWVNLIEHNFGPQTWTYYSEKGIDSVRLLKIDCEGCEFSSLLPWLENLCTEQILIEIHGCACGHCQHDLNRNATLRMIRTAGLLDALVVNYSVFHVEPNVRFSDGSCVEYGLRRRWPCPDGPRRPPVTQATRAWAKAVASQRASSVA